MISCAKCGRTGEFWNDVCDALGTEAIKHVFWLCEDCQREFWIRVREFLGVTE